MLNQTIGKIKPLDQDAMDAVQDRQNPIILRLCPEVCGEVYLPRWSVAL